MSDAPKEGDLQVWWVPQVPMKAFMVSVPDVATGKLLIDALAAYDTFQYENHVKPDFCNAGGINVFEDGEWFDYMEDDDDS